MNNKVFVANINWVKPADGGRVLPIPMNNERYCPIVSVDGQNTFLGSAFGLLCNSFKLIGEYNTLAYVRYLNTNDAPDNLHIGSKLELFEGSRLVAVGKIVQESEYKFKTVK